MAPVFVDVDTGVDDALALIYLLASPDADVVGIASTGGNVAVDQVCENNLGLLELCRITDVPVSKGSDETLTGPIPAPSAVHGTRGLGYADLPPTDSRLTDYDSATAWVRAAHAFPGELIGVATAPLTNLALALRAEPALPTLLRRLVIMGGAYDYRGNTTPVTEWNIGVDPDAAAEVFAAWSVNVVEPQRLPILCGLDLTRRIAMTPEHVARLAVAAGIEPGQSADSADRRRDAVLHGGLSRPRPWICSASARSACRRGRTRPAAHSDPARDGGRGADRNPDPRHDGNRLGGALGPRT